MQGYPQRYVVSTHIYTWVMKDNVEQGKNTAIDPYHLAAMLSLGGIKSFVFARQALARCELSVWLAMQKQSFLFS